MALNKLIILHYQVKHTFEQEYSGIPKLHFNYLYLIIMTEIKVEMKVGSSWSLCALAKYFVKYLNYQLAGRQWWWRRSVNIFGVKRDACNDYKQTQLKTVLVSRGYELICYGRSTRQRLFNYRLWTKLNHYRITKYYDRTYV